MCDATNYDREKTAKTESLHKKTTDIKKSEDKRKSIQMNVRRMQQFNTNIGKDIDSAKEFVEKKNEHMQLVKKKKDIMR